MSRILVLSLVFSPDGVSTSVIVSELAHDLKEKGHQITVLTTKPHYNVDEDARAGQPLKRRLWGLFYQSDYHGIPVWHTAMRPKGEWGLLGRILNYIVFHVISICLSIFAIGRQDIVFAVSPPLTIGIVGWLIALAKRARLIYNVQELYPDTAIMMGVLKEDSLFTQILKWMERFVYRRSHALAVICQLFADAISAKQISREKIHVIPNFVDIEFVQPRAKNNPLARDLGLEEKFVVLYAGNIGMTQSFDTILQVAHRLRDSPDIVFLIVGDGVRRTYLETQISAWKLTNVMLLPYQPRSRVPEIYGTSDLCLVPLMAGTEKTTVPSKLYTIMASGRPALVAVNEDSDIVQSVINAQCGLVVKPDDADALLQGIIQVSENREEFQKLGENGRQYAVHHLSRQAVSDQYHELILRTTDFHG